MRWASSLVRGLSLDHTILLTSLLTDVGLLFLVRLAAKDAGFTIKRGDKDAFIIWFDTPTPHEVYGQLREYQVVKSMIWHFTPARAKEKSP